MSENLLFFQTGLSLGTHFVNITASLSNAAQQLAFDYAMFTDTINEEYVVLFRNGYMG